MMAKILSRAIRAVCLGGMVLGTSAAVAEETSATLQYVEMAEGERFNVVAYSDPESEVSNGMKPARHVANDLETDVGDDSDVPMEVANFPEGEVGSGTEPPRSNP
jgi:hypothetical protein